MLLLKNILFIFLLSPIFFIELIIYKIFKKNCSYISHQYIIRFFSLTGGRSITLIDNFIKEKKKISFNNTNKNFNNFSINNTIKELNFNGYSINKDFLEDDKIEKIINHLKNLNGRYSGDTVSNNSLSAFNLERNKISTRFTYESNDLLEIPLIQKILLSDDILKIAQEYLNSLPIIDIVTAWWTFPTEKSDKHGAQFWHFDMDRTKWLKVFIYLNDVNMDNGPHCFISKSHQDSGINYNIRKLGYSRIKDDKIEKYYNDEDIKYIVAKKGSILFEDTRGLHKGLKVNKNSRLLLQFQYSTSLFGSKFKKLSLPRHQTALFKEMKEKNPLMFQGFE